VFVILNLDRFSLTYKHSGLQSIASSAFSSKPFNMTLPKGYPNPTHTAHYHQGFVANIWDQKCREKAQERAHRNRLLRAEGRSTAPPLPPRTDRGFFSKIASVMGFRKGEGLKSCFRGNQGRKRDRRVSFVESPDIVLIPNVNKGKKIPLQVREVEPKGIASMGRGSDFSLEAFRPDPSLTDLGKRRQGYADGGAIADDVDNMQKRPISLLASASPSG